MLNNVSIKFLLQSVLASILLLLVGFSVIVWQAINEMQTSANHMGMGKDVVADILPPPLYVVEAALVAEELRSTPSHGVAAKVSQLETLKRDYDARNRFWSESDLDPKVASPLLGEQRAAADRFWTIVLGDYITAIQAGNTADIDALHAQLKEAYQAHRVGINRTTEVASTYATETLAGLDATAESTRSLLITITAAGFTLIVILLAIAIHEIMRRLGDEPHLLQKVAQRIAAGDLTDDSLKRLNDKNSLLSSIQAMRDSLRAIIAESSRVSNELLMSAQALTRSCAEVASGSTRQNEAAFAMSAAVEEVSVTIEHVADSAKRAREQACANQRLTSEGSGLVQRTIDEIRQASTTVSETGGVIQVLGDKSSQISSIVEAIKSIAEQTNLLALNAAIEAARAGEQGRGFAVVADEVRSLAARTAQSTQEIASMIDGIQHGTENAVQSMEKGRSIVAGCAQMATKTGAAVEEINTVTNVLQTAIGEISLSLGEQSSASRELAQSLELINRMSDNNLESIKDISASARQLETLAEGLNGSVGRFRL